MYVLGIRSLQGDQGAHDIKLHLENKKDKKKHMFDEEFLALWKILGANMLFLAHSLHPKRFPLDFYRAV